MHLFCCWPRGQVTSLLWHGSDTHHHHSASLTSASWHHRFSQTGKSAPMAQGHHSRPCPFTWMAVYSGNADITTYSASLVADWMGPDASTSEPSCSVGNLILPQTLKLLLWFWQSLICFSSFIILEYIELVLVRQPASHPHWGRNEHVSTVHYG